MANYEQNANRGLLVGLLLLVLLGVISLNHWFGHQEGSAEPNDERPETGEQAVDPANAVILATEIEGSGRSSVSLTHQTEMTLLDLMQRAAEHSDDWRFHFQGRGAGAFLTQLAGLENEGAGGRNWQYEVNGKRAEMSFGACPLSRGDRVLWKFGPYE
jgi:hypothetical protein